MPAHTHTVTATADAQGYHAHNISIGAAGDHGHQINYVVGPFGGNGGINVVTSVGQASANAGGVTLNSGTHGHTATIDMQGLHAHAITASATMTGGGQTISWLQPFLLLLFYIKL